MDGKRLQKQLVDAAERGDCMGITAALDAGADVDGADTLTSIAEQPRRALVTAVSSGRVDAVKLLLQRGAGVSLSGAGAYDWLVPPLAAVKWRTADALAIARLLLDAGAHVNAANSFGNTALHFAAQASADGVRLLTGSGAHVDAQGSQGWRPLHAACFFDALTCVDALLAAGADVTAVDDKGNTAAHWAALSLYLNSLPAITGMLVLAGARLDGVNLAGHTPLMHAEAIGDWHCHLPAATQVLLAAGAAAEPDVWPALKTRGVPSDKLAALLREAAWARRGHMIRLYRRAAQAKAAAAAARRAARQAAAAAAGGDDVAPPEAAAAGEGVPAGGQAGSCHA
jgi:ankyrin repeat protein